MFNVSIKRKKIQTQGSMYGLHKYHVYVVICKNMDWLHNNEHVDIMNFIYSSMFQGCFCGQKYKNILIFSHLKNISLIKMEKQSPNFGLFHFYLCKSNHLTSQILYISTFPTLDLGKSNHLTFGLFHFYLWKSNHLTFQILYISIFLTLDDHILSYIRKVK